MLQKSLLVQKISDKGLLEIPRRFESEDLLFVFFFWAKLAFLLSEGEIAITSKRLKAET